MSEVIYTPVHMSESVPINGGDFETRVVDLAKRISDLPGEDEREIARLATVAAGTTDRMPSRLTEKDAAEVKRLAALVSGAPDRPGRPTKYEASEIARLSALARRSANR